MGDRFDGTTKGRQYSGDCGPVPGRRHVDAEAGMWVIFLEAGVALALLLIIVWVSWPKGRDAKKDEGSSEHDE